MELITLSSGRLMCLQIQATHYTANILFNDLSDFRNRFMVGSVAIEVFEARTPNQACRDAFTAPSIAAGSTMSLLK